MKRLMNHACCRALTVLALLASTTVRSDEAAFRLGEASGTPGTEVRVSFSIESDSDVRAFTTAINFDESVIEIVGVEPLWVVPPELSEVPNGGRSGYPYYNDAVNWGFYHAVYDNSDDAPGNGDDEGGVLVGGVWSFSHYVALPAGESTEVLAFDFLIDPDASPGTTELRFQDFMTLPNTPPDIKNFVCVDTCTTPFSPEQSVTPIFIDGRLNVVGDVSLFIRGDANGDLQVDVSDPTATLGHFFRGEAPLPCLDAADANDDGVVDVSDAIATLNFLFRDAAPLPPPASSPGADPTPDALTCGAGSE